MSALTKLSVATCLSAIFLCASPARGMDFEMFDKLSPQDQQDYLKFLVKNVQMVLIDQGQPEPASKVVELFRKKSGRHQSVGETQFYEMLMILRTFYREPSPFKFSSIVGQVEGALVQVLIHNGVRFPVKFMRAFSESVRAKPFWPKRPLRT